MVRLICIIQMYFLFKQSQWVSNKQVSNVLCQKMINSYKIKSLKIKFTIRDIKVEFIK